MLLIKHAEIYRAANPIQKNSGLLDVRCAQGKITEVGSDLPSQKGETIIDAKGGALIPGLHDHHIHLFALAAASYSIDCGPPDINSASDLANTLKDAPGNDWIRGVGYHESVAGLLSSKQIDQWVEDRPVRIQHRSGKMWFVNSKAANLLELYQHRSMEGIDCDDNNLPTGRLFRMDQWLRDQLASNSELDISSTSQRLASFGITGITDATATNSLATSRYYAELINSKKILQKVMLMGDHTLSAPEHSGLTRGAFKILLDDAALPDFECLKNDITFAHRQHRPVAIHCVTNIELIFALSALKEMGARVGDRIEHASVTDSDTIELIRESGVTVVTQTNFIAERGDQYASDFSAEEHDSLYRCQSLLDFNIPVGGSTDAPYGHPDPWQSMSAAVNRTTKKGLVLGKKERVSPEQALKLFTTAAEDPGGLMKVISPGSDADLCLLERNWNESRRRLSCDNVVLTIRSGEIIYQK